jgi:sulfite exporter TauE/SafE
LLGFFLVLRSKLANPANYWAKGAMWGLLGYGLVYTIIMFLNIGDWYIRYYDPTGVSISTDPSEISYSFFYSPISHIAETFFPPQYTQNSAGSITGITTSILAVTYKFLDICTYITIGAIIGKLSINKKGFNLPHMFIIGIVLLTIGFFIAPIIQSASLSTPIFLLGFFLVLRSKLANPANYWAKGAMWGLLGYVLVYTIIMFFILTFFNVGDWFIVYYQSTDYSSISQTYVYSPISLIAETSFPPEYIQNPDGSITGITTLILAVTYKFLDICIYISIGAIIGKLFIKQKSS